MFGAVVVSPMRVKTMSIMEGVREGGKCVSGRWKKERILLTQKVHDHQFIPHNSCGSLLAHLQLHMETTQRSRKWRVKLRHLHAKHRIAWVVRRAKTEEWTSSLGAD